MVEPDVSFLSRISDCLPGLHSFRRFGCRVPSLPPCLYRERTAGFFELCAEKCVQVKLIINEQAHLYGYMHEPSIICNGSRFYIGNADSDTLFTMEPDFALKPLLVRTPSHNEEGNQYGLFLKGVAGPYLFDQATDGDTYEQH